MNSKILIGGILAFLISFLCGWLVFGYLLVDFYTQYSNHFTGLHKDPMLMWPMLVSNLAYGFLLTYVVHIASVKTVAKGAMVGTIVSVLITLSFDMFIFSQMNLIGYRVMVADVVANGAIGGLIGAVLGWWSSRGESASA